MLHTDPSVPTHKTPMHKLHRNMLLPTLLATKMLAWPRLSAENGGEFFRKRRGYGEYDDAEEDIRDANLTDEVGCYVREDVATEKNGEIAEYTKVNVIGDAVLGIPVGMPGRVSAVPLSLRLTVEAA